MPVKLGVFCRGDLVKSDIVFDYTLLMDQLYDPNIYWIDNTGYLFGKKVYEIEEVLEIKSRRGRPTKTGLIDSLIEVIKKRGEIEVVKKLTHKDIVRKFEISFPSAVKLKKRIEAL